MLHATGALLSDSALPVLLCCPALTKRTVKWLFQSPHSSDMGVQLTSCTSRNRKCVKRSLLPPPWLSCVPAKVLCLHFHRIVLSKPSLIIKVATVTIACIHVSLSVVFYALYHHISAQISPYSPNPRFSRFIDHQYTPSLLICLSQTFSYY